MSGSKVWDFWAGKYDKLWVQKYSLSPTRRNILIELKKLLEPNKTYRILDMGCGIGQLIIDMKHQFNDFNIEYVGVDLSSKMIEIAKKEDEGTLYINKGIEDFTSDNSFDIIICTHSFPYYKDKKKSIEKFNSLLNKKGYLILAQASANTLYDHVAMFFVKFSTGSAKYLSINSIKKLISGSFKCKELVEIKEKYYMPTICLFLLEKESKI